MKRCELNVVILRGKPRQRSHTCGYIFGARRRQAVVEIRNYSPQFERADPRGRSSRWSNKMSDKKTGDSSGRGVKHGLKTTDSKLSHAMKKRKIVQLTIDQHLAPGLRDSSFGQLPEEVMFNILSHLSRKFSIIDPSISSCNASVVFCEMWM